MWSKYQAMIEMKSIRQWDAINLWVKVTDLKEDFNSLSHGAPREVKTSMYKLLEEMSTLQSHIEAYCESLGIDPEDPRWQEAIQRFDET